MKKGKNVIVVLGKNHSMELEHIPVPTIEADVVDAPLVANAEDVADEIKAEKKASKSKPTKKDKSTKPSNGTKVERRGRPSGSFKAGSLNQLKIEARTALIASGVVIKRGRPAGTAKVSVVGSSPRLVLNKTNSIKIDGKTFITLLKANNIKKEAAELIDYKSTVVHPKLGKLVLYLA